MPVPPLPALIPALSTRDLTDPANGPHALALMADAAIGALTRLWGCPSRVLRGHTTPGDAPELRRLAAEADPSDEVLLALPGICHRRDSIARLHDAGASHQLDLWLLRRGGRRLDHHDLTDMVTALTAAVLPRRHWRWIERVHPYTTGGRQVDIVDGGEVVELAECGVATPSVLDEAGLDSRLWSGLALGMSLDRAVMLRPPE